MFLQHNFSKGHLEQTFYNFSCPTLFLFFCYFICVVHVIFFSFPLFFFSLSRSISFFLPHSFIHYFTSSLSLTLSLSLSVSFRPSSSFSLCFLSFPSIFQFSYLCTNTFCYFGLLLCFLFPFLIFSLSISPFSLAPAFLLFHSSFGGRH